MTNLYADLIINNGSLITVNNNNDIEEAIAILNNKILDVGSNDSINKYIGPSTKIIDANNNTIMPGFIDTHIHFLAYGLLDIAIIDLTYPKAKSIEDIKNIIKTETKNKKDGTWIILQGYDHNKLIEKRHPTKKDLDQVAPNHPVQCTRICNHMAVYNTKAFEIARFTKDNIVDPDEVPLDENGEIKGLLKEASNNYMRPFVKMDINDILKSFENASNIMLENGITTAHDAGASGGDSLKIMQYVADKGIIKTRLRPMLFSLNGKEESKQYIDSFINTGVYTGLGNDKFSLGPVKIMIDGSSSGPSAKMIEPYSHDESSDGILVWEEDEVIETLTKAHNAGFQITAHAVGDRAVEIMVNAIENALKETPREDHRHRIEHCGINNPELIKRIKDLGIIPIANPSFISINGSDYNRFYGERVNYMFPLKSYLDNDIIAAIGSDAPVTHPNPILGIHGAINRIDINTKEFAGRNQQVEILDILRMFTYNGAYASFEEDIKGSLEVGKLADIVILSENILEYPKEDILDIKVDYTILDGVVEYTRK